MEDSDYPQLFQISDKGSKEAQKRYLCLVKVELTVIILAAISSNININYLKFEKILYSATAIFLFFALIARIFKELIGYDKQWFNCRAIAESVKSITWKYMIQAKPYQDSMTPEELDGKFIEDLKQIRAKKLAAAKKLGKQNITGSEITQKMRDVRNESFNERKSFYLEDRLENQKKWYSEKTKINKTKETSYFWISLSIEAVAVILAFLFLSIPSIKINPVGILITIVAVIIAWSQIKKHRELSQSYCLVAQELGQISSMYIHINNEEKLSNFVEETECVISKEHNLWLYRREY